jgi:hypothetical protein
MIDSSEGLPANFAVIFIHSAGEGIASRSGATSHSLDLLKLPFSTSSL